LVAAKHCSLRGYHPEPSTGTAKVNVAHASRDRRSNLDDIEQSEPDEEFNHGWTRMGSRRPVGPVRNAGMYRATEFGKIIRVHPWLKTVPVASRAAIPQFAPIRAIRVHPSCASRRLSKKPQKGVALKNSADRVRVRFLRSGCF
jgi:hypothetical protein